LHTPAAPRVTINADDFGLSRSVNAAIIGGFKARLIDTCTIMANAPAFEEACDLAHACGVASLIGIHFVLDDGVPLTEELRREPRFCGFDGRMLARVPGALVWLSSSERRAVAAELVAQIARCRSFGLHPTHLDSHHHVHEELGIARVVLPAMQQQDIRFVRPMQNLRRCRTLIRRFYTRAFNRSLKWRCISWTEYFGSVSDYLARWSVDGPPPPGTTVELMVHPTLRAEDGTIVDGGGHTSLRYLGTCRESPQLQSATGGQ
jgi:predicted glycoside hydrolase/deacetylase ChbG (UPF0249 family)